MVREDSKMDVLDLQLLIMFYKAEVKREPDNLANQALLARSRNKLKDMK
jgi:hypothetical protein